MFIVCRKLMRKVPHPTELLEDEIQDNEHDNIVYEYLIGTTEYIKRELSRESCLLGSSLEQDQFIFEVITPFLSPPPLPSPLPLPPPSSPFLPLPSPSSPILPQGTEYFIKRVYNLINNIKLRPKSLVKAYKKV